MKIVLAVAVVVVVVVGEVEVPLVQVMVRRVEHVRLVEGEVVWIASVVAAVDDALPLSPLMLAVEV